MTDSRILTEYVEAATAGTPSSQIDTLYIETATAGTPNRQLDTLYVETATSANPNRQLDTMYVEVLTPSVLGPASGSGSGYFQWTGSGTGKSPVVTNHLKRYESGAWVPYTGVTKVWLNGAWVYKQGKYWNGTSWVNLP